MAKKRKEIEDCKTVAEVDQMVSEIVAEALPNAYKDSKPVRLTGAELNKQMREWRRQDRLRQHGY